MSQIRFPTQKAGEDQTFTAVIGWDRRLCEVFDFIDPASLPDADEEEEGEDEAPIWGLSFGLQFAKCDSAIRRHFEASGFSLPEAAMEALARHVALNAGNVIVTLDNEGKLTEHSL